MCLWGCWYLATTVVTVVVGVAVVMSVTARVTEMVGAPAESGSLRSWGTTPMVGDESGGGKARFLSPAVVT